VTSAIERRVSEAAIFIVVGVVLLVIALVLGADGSDPGLDTIPPPAYSVLAPSTVPSSNP
jgi:hypothetical protein